MNGPEDEVDEPVVLLARQVRHMRTAILKWVPPMLSL